MIGGRDLVMRPRSTSAHACASSSSVRLGLLLTFLAGLLLHASLAAAAPEARILRIDPRADRENGQPVITTLVDVVQNKRVSEAIAPCAALRGDAQLGCMSEALEKPLYEPFPFPEKNALFTVTVDDMDRPAKFISQQKWGDSPREPGVGTAWLILVDADNRMGKSFADARTLAGRFVAALGPNDIVNVMFFNDRQVVRDSAWLPSAQKAQAQRLIDSISDGYPSGGRNRPLLSIIKGAATDAFKALGNVGSNVTVPMHQAMVVLSNGFGGTDPSTTGPGALQLSSYMSNGRFPENNTALPKTPVPVISVYFPLSTYDEFKNNSLDFMQNLANPEIGGFFNVMRLGQGARSDNIVRAVRTRFSKMNVVKWRVSCIAPQVTQSFKLGFTNVTPPIAGDATFQEVPIGIDPTSWPLDVDKLLTQASVRDGVYPGGRFKVFGDFCWGGDKSRADVYFLPAGNTPPAELKGTDIEAAKRAQKQLIAQGMRGTALDTTDTFVEFEAPDSDKIVHGSGANAVVRVVLYDNRAARTSGVTADTIVELKATTAPFPLLWVLGGMFGLTVVALLVVVVVKSGSKKRPTGQAQGYTPPAAPARGGFSPVAAPVVSQPPAKPASSATLQGAAGVFTVDQGVEVKAGRDEKECAVLLMEPRVSAVHASLKIEGGRFWVRDEHSNNGTFVNNTQVAGNTWTPVASGARLRFGPVEFSVRLD
jgi:hypothetical protein